jgi:hypothetical protein
MIIEVLCSTRHDDVEDDFLIKRQLKVKIFQISTVTYAVQFSKVFTSKYIKDLNSGTQRGKLFIHLKSSVSSRC